MAIDGGVNPGTRLTSWAIGLYVRPTWYETRPGSPRPLATFTRAHEEDHRGTTIPEKHGGTNLERLGVDWVTDQLSKALISGRLPISYPPFHFPPYTRRRPVYV